MNKYERTHTTFSNEPRSNNGFSERGSRREDTSLVAQHGLRCDLLRMAKLTVKLHLQPSTVAALVANGHANAKVGERLVNVIEAAPRQSDVMRKILGARDDAWLAVCRKPHRLRFVELGILERSESKQSASKARMQPLLGDVDLIPNDEFQRRWQITDDRGLSST